MAAPKKTNLPTNERLALQAHIRDGLRCLGLDQSQWADEIVALRSISGRTKFEQNAERVRQYKGVYNFVRTHLKKNDLHFTCETADQLAEWFVLIIAARLRAMGDRPELHGDSTTSQDGTVIGGVFGELLNFWSQWAEVLSRVAPELKNWYKERRIELLITRDSVPLLAEFLVGALKSSGRINKKQASEFKEIMVSAIEADARVMGENFASTWAHKLRKWQRSPENQSFRVAETSDGMTVSENEASASDPFFIFREVVNRQAWPPPENPQHSVWKRAALLQRGKGASQISRAAERKRGTTRASD